MDTVLLETRGLTKRFGGFTAVDQVDLRICRGTVHSLIGPNGAGKSTLLGLITKSLPLSAGTIHFRGVDVTRKSAAQLARGGVGRSFQISAVFPGLSVRDNLRMALMQPLGLSFHFWQPQSVLNRLDGRAEELAAQVGLSDWCDSIVGALPYGRKRALELATALALEPEILLLDEPMAGLGREDIATITDLLKTMARDRTIVLVEHNLSVVATLSNVITVLVRGRILVEGSYADISANPEVRTAYLGPDASAGTHDTKGVG